MVDCFVTYFFLYSATMHIVLMKQKYLHITHAYEAFPSNVCICVFFIVLLHRIKDEYCLEHKRNVHEMILI